MFTVQESSLIPVRDKASAIKNLGGMTWLYDKHLAKFKNTYSDSPSVIRRFLMEGNTDSARRLAHSVKGLAGTLGFLQLYYAASILERAILSSGSAVDDFLDIYETCLQEVLTEDSKA